MGSGRWFRRVSAGRAEDYPRHRRRGPGPDDADSKDLVRSLLAQRYRLLASVEQDQTGRLATIRLACPVGDGDVVVDLLFASTGIEPEIIRAADTTEVVPDLDLPIATTGHLIALKALARDDRSRPQDLADLRALLASASPHPATSGRRKCPCPAW